MFCRRHLFNEWIRVQKLNQSEKSEALRYWFVAARNAFFGGWVFVTWFVEYFLIYYKSGNFGDL